MVFLGVVWLVRTPAKPGKFDTFAQCIADSGTTFYGTFWCSNCQNQKAKFGSSVKLLPYVECSPKSGKGQLPICTDADIEAYPTWEFPDGSRVKGDISLERISEATSCPLVEDLEPTLE